MGTPLKRIGVVRVSVRRRWDVEMVSVRMAVKVESKALRQSGLARWYRLAFMGRRFPPRTISRMWPPASVQTAVTGPLRRTR